MSVMNARRFIDQLLAEPNVVTQFYVANPRTPEKVLRWAGAKGWAFTADDYLKAAADYPDKPIVEAIRRRVAGEVIF